MPRPAIVPVPVESVAAPMPETLDPSDAVAMVEADGPDWEPPPWQDLRSGLKAAPGTLSVTLSLSETEPVLGEVVNLTLNSTAPTPVTVCVRGVESGVVWRGDIPQGRVPLTLDGAALGYQFATPGRYAFAVSLGDDPRCVDPVQRLMVGVP